MLTSINSNICHRKKPAVWMQPPAVIARGRQEKLYLLFKGKTGTENLLKLDWFQFTKDRMK
ncbi:hypothetical protein [Bacteroides fragilis]|uniref:hypothetical protein n=1 Tax=Bacteroides fragilis TaxID=817 RepID=UPI001DC8EE86|nr:hypothetical protein [Bacteroides fragilis]MCZ2503209.1 hypothetical protein [Bacteroides fragilis]HJG69965.1 hypothetical protein [Bacteroides fragilis]